MSLPTNTRPPHCVRNIQTTGSRRRRCLVSKIQNGGQPTGSSNISETTKHIVEIPTATPTFSGSTAPVAVLPTSPHVDLSRTSKMAVGLTDVLIPSLVLQMRRSFQNQYNGLRLCTKRLYVQRMRSTIGWARWAMVHPIFVINGP